MEDERFKDLLARITNFTRENPFRWDEAFCAAYPSYAYLLVDYSPADRPSDAEYDEYRERLKEFVRAPGKLRDASNQHRKQVIEFRRSLRRDFPEWHYSKGSSLGDFAGGDCGISIQNDLSEVWKLASTKQTDKAKTKLWRMSERFMRHAEWSRATTGTRDSRENPKGEVYQKEPEPSVASALDQMVKTLEWLQKQLGKLKICENPKCRGRRYFFRDKNRNNQRYCHPKCGGNAKDLRRAKRAPKEYKLSDEIRENMSIAKKKYWAKKKMAELRDSALAPGKPATRR